MRRLICKTKYCKYHGNNDVCTKSTVEISGSSCVSFEKGFVYYIHLVYDELSHSNFIIPNNLTEDLKIGLYYVMELFDLIYSIKEYGTWRMIMLHKKGETAALTTDDILKLPLNHEKFTHLYEEFNKGNLPNKDVKAEPPKVESQPFGWLSPTGDFTEGDFGEHEQVAWDIMRRKNFVDEYTEQLDTARSETARDFLSCVKGYALIHNPSADGGYIVSYEKPLTKKQKEFLYGYFIDMGDKFKAELYLN